MKGRNPSPCKSCGKTRSEADAESFEQKSSVQIAKANELLYQIGRAFWELCDYPQVGIWVQITDRLTRSVVMSLREAGIVETTTNEVGKTFVRWPSEPIRMIPGNSSDTPVTRKGAPRKNPGRPRNAEPIRRAK